MHVEVEEPEIVKAQDLIAGVSQARLERDTPEV
jgi:hypothetical protein